MYPFIPGLPSHPQYDLVNKQCCGYSGMVSFEIKGNLQTAKTFLENCKVIFSSYFSLHYKGVVCFNIEIEKRPFPNRKALCFMLHPLLFIKLFQLGLHNQLTLGQQHLNDYSKPTNASFNHIWTLLWFYFLAKISVTPTPNPHPER